MRRRNQYNVVTLLLVVSLGAPLWAEQISEGVQALSKLEYKREVLGYCGLNDPDAVHGYLDRRVTLMAEYEFDDAALLEAGTIARKKSYAEWQNRGLGGFRAWCQNEGNEYMTILQSYVLE